MHGIPYLYSRQKLTLFNSRCKSHVFATVVVVAFIIVLAVLFNKVLLSAVPFVVPILKEARHSLYLFVAYKQKHYT